MYRTAEGLLFLAMATGLHLAAWPAGDDNGLQAAGDGGDALLTVAAASASISQMVDVWDTPPDPVAQEPQTLHTPEAPELPPSPTITKAAPQPKPASPEAMTRPEMPFLEQAAPLPTETTQAPPPPPKPKLTKATKPPEQAPPKTVEKTPPKPEAQPTPKAKQSSKASAAVAASQATGAGKKQAAGHNGNAVEATLSKKKRASLTAKWGAQIRARIARRGMTRGAGKGTAYVRITVSSTGTLLSAKLSKSSGNGEIDKIALLAVRRAGSFPPAPKGLGSDRKTFVLPISSR
ncbi:MAG: TonB family protein [Rhodobacteraceae bacterium]|nr:TonB family protein [Paracoccaceae bacterium]